MLHRLPHHRVAAANKTGTPEVGYRHIDCAQVYGNEKEIGAVLERQFEDGVVKREVLWITSKLRGEENYKRSVLACFVQAVYVFEMDRQEKRTEMNALAPGWWIPFKYKILRELIDESDGSIVGVILEWDRSASASNYVFSRPNGAPEAVLALRGVLVTSPTSVRDMISSGRIATVGNLEGSPRFGRAMAEITSLIERHGSNNVCVAGHSLGAAYALQLAGKVDRRVEVHAFNPPCGLLHGILRPIVWDITVSAWSKARRLFRQSQPAGVDEGETELVPHVYVNRNDYVSLAYRKKPLSDSKVYTCSLENGNEGFLAAHGVAQWWSDDLKLVIEFVYR